MTQTLELNGYNIYDSFLSGYENLLLHKNRINDINVFPVPDGDTGNNMVSTFQYAIQGPGAFGRARKLGHNTRAVSERTRRRVRGKAHHERGGIRFGA